MEPFEDKVRRGGAVAIEEVDRFFMKEDAVYKTLHVITAKLEQLSIPYAVAGGMALVGHGYRRTTVGVEHTGDFRGPRPYSSTSGRSWLHAALRRK